MGKGNRKNLLGEEKEVPITQLIYFNTDLPKQTCLAEKHNATTQSRDR